jgi:dihydropteroate synthase
MQNKRTTLNCNGKLILLDRPLIMGILNVTPDSFYDGGRYNTEFTILQRCETILEEGGDIIDVGAVSTRPHSEQTDAEGEQKRLDFALSLIRKRFPDTIISLDTYRADIARHMVTTYGVNIVNDISAGTIDVQMFDAIAALQVPYVLMHMQGTPETMQMNPVYHNLMTDISDFFSDNIARLRSTGVKDIIIDPGFGFGKTVTHNYTLLRQMQQLEIFECPILVGVSRKSMIYNLLKTDAQHALNGTSAVNTLALMHGADILRVHDVKEAVECVKIMQMYKNT